MQPIVVREKKKIAGIWMNADSNRFRSAPTSSKAQSLMQRMQQRGLGHAFLEHL